MSIGKQVPWSLAEAKQFVHQILPLKNEKGLTWTQVDNRMIDLGWPERGGEGRRNATRTNTLVRGEMFGDAVYEERREEVLKQDLTKGKMGPISVIQTNRPRTEEEIAELFGINTELFYAYKVRTNQWANNWQTRIEWALNESEAVSEILLSDKAIEHLEALAPAFPEETRPACSGNMLDVIEIVDPHHGAKSWARETGTNWDLELSIPEHRKAHAHFLARKDPNATRCLLRLGDDFCHFDTLIDGRAGATQKGTIQDIDSRWQKMFLDASKLGIELIQSTLDTYEEVDVVLIQGNHDWQTSYYLGQVWQAWFRNHPRIRFDCEPRKRKYYRWGTTLLGMVHKPGKTGVKMLPDNMKEEARVDWGECDYAEFHMGDEHHEECIDLTGTGVVIRKLRGLVPNDSWHDEEGYSSHRGAQMFTYHSTEGLDRITYYRTTKHSPYRGDVDVGPYLRD
jgi:hypothetical protein